MILSLCQREIADELRVHANELRVLANESVSYIKFWLKNDQDHLLLN